MLDEVRYVRRPEDGCAEAVGGVGGLVDLRTADGEWLGVERGIVAVPEDSAMGLVGIEIAEVPAPAEAAPSTASSEATAPTAASSARTEGNISSARAAGATRVAALAGFFGDAG